MAWTTNASLARFAGCSHAGVAGRENEDRWLADPQQGLFIVADGMGGHTAGGLAAQLVVDLLPRLISSVPEEDQSEGPQDTADGLCQRVCTLSQLVREETAGRPGLDGMGSTLVLARLDPTHATIVHVGDSRAYLLRNGQISRLTKDHDMAQWLVDCRELNTGEAADHPASHRLTQYIGMPAPPKPGCNILAVQPRDALLLCSDGLHGTVGDKKLETILRDEGSPTSLAQTLVDAAVAAGGTDNITALLIVPETPSAKADVTRESPDDVE